MRVITYADLDKMATVLIDVIKGVREVQTVSADVEVDDGFREVTMRLWCTVGDDVDLNMVTNDVRRDVQIAVRLFETPVAVQVGVEALIRPAGEQGDLWEAAYRLGGLKGVQALKDRPDVGAVDVMGIVYCDA
jgi:hypothetical protein